MNIILKDKIKIDNNFINDLITKSWQESESLQNQINSIEIDSPQAARLVNLLKDLLTRYYVFTGCLENLETEPIEVTVPEYPTQEELINVHKVSTGISSEPVIETSSNVATLDELDNNEPFEYFVDFDEPVGEPLTDKDLYN
jgi:hypothetical protein